uniref:Secreted protein n=1 Tax=Arundo donax TaxID=35708 RepID=A0A0A9GBA0_ARUDO
MCVLVSILICSMILPPFPSRHPTWRRGTMRREVVFPLSRGSFPRGPYSPSSSPSSASDSRIRRCTMRSASCAGENMGGRPSASRRAPSTVSMTRT